MLNRFSWIHWANEEEPKKQKQEIQRKEKMKQEDEKKIELWQ